MEYPFFSKVAILDVLKKNQAGIRKSLGQNFLIDPNYVNKIIHEVQKSIPVGNSILEIGPGLGVLTFHLLRYYKTEVVEIDSVFCKILQELYKDYIKIHNIDYLKFIQENKLEFYHYIVGNLPYYITTDILVQTVRNLKDGLCIFLVQKEYAEKLIQDNHSIAIYVQNFGNIEPLFIVPKSVFFPKPKVDSMLIRIKTHPYPKSHPETLEKILRMSFRQRRKKIINSWQKGEELVNREILISLSKKIQFDFNKRAEEISKEQYYALTNEISLFF